MEPSPSEGIAKMSADLAAAMARLRELCGGEPVPGYEARLTGIPNRLAELQEQFDAVPAAAKKAAAETKDRIVGQVRAAYAAKGLPYPPAKEELAPMDTPEAAQRYLHRYLEKYQPTPKEIQDLLQSMHGPIPIARPLPPAPSRPEDREIWEDWNEDP